MIYPKIIEQCDNVNLLINISRIIDDAYLPMKYPKYSIEAEKPGVEFLQGWEQVLDFRRKYRDVLDKIRTDHGEHVTIHLYPATPNPIDFEMGKRILKNLDPTIKLYDKIQRRRKNIKMRCAFIAESDRDI